LVSHLIRERRNMKFSVTRFAQFFDSLTIIK
jgi:hypothetical protein